MGRVLLITNHVFQDPRLADIGHVIEDECAIIRDNYGRTLLASLLQSNMAPETPVGLFNCPQVAAGFLSFVEISYHHCAWPSRI